MTMTSLPAAEMNVAVLVSVEKDLRVGLKKLHGEVNAFELAAFDGQIRGLVAPGAEDDGIEFLQAASPQDNSRPLRCS